MATVLRAPTFRAPLPSNKTSPLSSKPTKPVSLIFSFKRSNSTSSICSRSPSRFTPSLFSSFRSAKFVPFTFDGDTETTQVEEVQQFEVQDSPVSEGAVEVEDNAIAAEVVETEEPPASALLTLFQSYKEAIISDDESKLADLISSLKSFEDEKISLEGNVASLSEELSTERDRVLRISADFDNFRKRTERERLSLVTNAQGEVVESLLPVLDNFERAKAQIKVETEGEEKINNSYQSIYKQFGEILVSLGVNPVETVGKPFDPLLHEAIMREDSAEFEEGIIIQEFRKGFQIGDRLLRPAMVKVSAGPGPAKPEQEAAAEGQEGTSEAPEGGHETESSA